MSGAIFIIGLALGLATSVSAQTDIYILAGQSNMTGVAPLAGEPTPQNQSLSSLASILTNQDLNTGMIYR
jgi:hypothetical protein